MADLRVTLVQQPLVWQDAAANRERFAARAYAWRQLLRARAIGNQAYVVGVNRVGSDGLGVPHPGDSAAIDYLGQPLFEAGAEPALLTVTLDGAKLHAFRDKFPAHLDADRFTLEL